MIVQKRIDLGLLKEELAAAGVAVGALGRAGDDLFTYDAAGARAELPQAAEAVVAAHTAPPREPDRLRRLRQAGTTAEIKAALLAYLEGRD
jgi:hypothetical protein